MTQPPVQPTVKLEWKEPVYTAELEARAPTQLKLHSPSLLNLIKSGESLDRDISLQAVSLNHNTTTNILAILVELADGRTWNYTIELGLPTQSPLVTQTPAGSFQIKEVLVLTGFMASLVSVVITDYLYSFEMTWN